MSKLKLHNTLSRKLETFEPQEEGKASVYSCGPTVYNFVHIGNLRTFAWNDLLVRYLRWKGLDVTWVMNITDIDDKIIRGANEKGVDIYEYSRPYTKAFFENLETLRIQKADVHPLATEHIDEMIEIVEQLRNAGHTYDADGSVYFDISSLEGYGKLSGVDVHSDQTRSRIEADEYERDNARDFVLWKGKREGEPHWEAPIGDGRPGWHLECSAMSMKYLGETFDIHTGAVDLIFPHHENEIAQSEGATAKPFVRYWIHGEHLVVDAQKMSKSEGNFYTLPDLLDKGYSALQIRYALIAVPYRTKLNFTLKSLDDAAAALERLELFSIRISELAGEGNGGTPSEKVASLVESTRREFEEKMDDDLNTAGALGAIFTLVRDFNIAADADEIVPADAAHVGETFLELSSLLDILPEREDLDSEIQALVDARNEARRNRDFAESDRLRDELASKGIILEDTPTGTRWRRR